jgi:hypothetical protein
MTSAAEFVICNYAIILTFRDPSQKLPLAILRGRISMPRPESTPRKVRVSHIIGGDTGRHYVAMFSGLWFEKVVVRPLEVA